MSVLKPYIVIFLLGSIQILLLVSGSVNVSNDNPGSSQNPVFVSFVSMTNGKSFGYRSVTRYKDGFLAVGSEGRMDWISETGKITKSQTFPGEDFNCVLSDDKTIIISGDNGILRISFDGGIFRKIENTTTRNINSLTFFNGAIIGGADQGLIISGDTGGDFKEIKLKLRGNIVSVSSRSTECFGVTDEGEIIHTRDGILWDIMDFNKVYSGYYKSCYFTKVLVTENRIVVTGIQIDGSPVVMFSNQGGVWTERQLYYSDDQGMKMFLSDSPNDVIYDEATDQLFLACDNGKLMQLPACSQCNKVASFQNQDFKGISISENTIMLVGKNYFIKALNIR